MSILTAFYDLEHGPISYDFVTFLVRAMKEQAERKCDKLHVVIVPKENGVGGFSRDWGGHDEADARWRLWHIIVASCALAGATVTIAPSRGYASAIAYDDRVLFGWWPDGKAHFMGPLVEASRRGEVIPKLRATEGARRYVKEWLSVIKQPVVTLTLRNLPRDSARNSDPVEWEKFLEWLEDERGFYALRVYDSDEALRVGIGYVHLDPDLRLALYEQSAMNIIGNNGPQELLKFSDAPYFIFGLGLEAWREHFRKYFSMEYGQQLPWAKANQTLVYKPATFENMKEEFDRAR